MLLFVFCPLIIVLLCLYIHYQTHFHLTSREKKTAKNTPRSPNTQKRNFKKDDEFDFFPTSFLFYMAFVIFLCILTMVVEIFYIVIDSESNLFVIFFSLSFVSYHQHSIDEIDDLSLRSYNIYIIYVYIIDLILIYGIMILSIWESLFSFYRYYTTRSSAQFLTIPSIKDVLQIYVIYAILFVVIFVIEIHLYYYIFPLVVLCHFGFNCYCTSRFSSIILNKYKITENGSIQIKDESNDSRIRIIKSVHFVRKASIISYLVQSIYLSVFLITYNVNTIYYLPLFWSISCFILTMNFIRNRIYLYHKYTTLRNFFCCQINTKLNENPSHSLFLTDDGNLNRTDFKKQIKIVVECDDTKIDNHDKKMQDDDASGLVTSDPLKVLDLLGVTTPDRFDANNIETSKYRMIKMLTSVSEKILNTSVCKENTRIKLENNNSDHIVLCRVKKSKATRFLDATTSSSTTVANVSKFTSSSCPSSPLFSHTVEITEAKLEYFASQPVTRNTKTKSSIDAQTEKNNEVKQHKEIDLQSIGFNFVDADYEMDLEHKEAEFNMIDDDTDSDDEEP